MTTRHNSSAARHQLSAAANPIEDVEMTNSADEAESDIEGELHHDVEDTGMYEIINHVAVLLCSVTEE